MYKLTTLIYLTMISMVQAYEPYNESIDGDPYADPLGPGMIIFFLLFIIGALLYDRR